MPASGIGNPVCHPPARITRSSMPIRFATAKMSAHAISEGAGRPRVPWESEGGAVLGATPFGVGGAAEKNPPLDPSVVIDDIARPPITDEQFQLRESLEHGSGKARSLLGDHDDLVVAEFLDEPLRWDRFTVDGDLGVIGQHRPVAVVHGYADVVVEDGDLRHA